MRKIPYNNDNRCIHEQSERHSYPEFFLERLMMEHALAENASDSAHTERSSEQRSLADAPSVHLRYKLVNAHKQERYDIPYAPYAYQI